MKYIVLIVFLFQASQTFALPQAVGEALNIKAAQRTFSEHNNGTLSRPFHTAIHDVSFFGKNILLKDIAITSETPEELALISHHGVSVAQVYNQTIQSIHESEFKTIQVMTKGIYVEDFKRSVALWRKNNIKLVNLSMTLRNPEIVQLLNEFISDGAIVVASSGNGAERFGRALLSQYEDFKGLTVSATNTSGELEAFSHHNSVRSVAVPGSRDLYPVNILKYNIAPRMQPTELSNELSIREHHFGMTSAAAPVVSGLVAMALQLDSKLNQRQVNLLIRNAKSDKGMVDADKFLRLVLINKEFKLFFHSSYRALMCSDNIFDFIQILKGKNLIREGEAQVIHLRKKMAPWADIRPQLARNDQKSWSFHAFMKIGNLVFDFDYTDSPTIEPQKSYALKMWSNNSNILYQSVDAINYKKAYLGGSMSSELRNWNPHGN